MFEQLFENVRQKSPLVHNITNYVTVNDCANMLLACGASPIMADDPEEVEDITSICGGLTINIGTLNQRTISAMIVAGRKANELGHPVVLDPVGAGASGLRTRTALQLLREVRFAVIRGNASEIRTLADGCGSTQGVDVSEEDKGMDLEQTAALAERFAIETRAVVVITGSVDVITDGQKTIFISNGRPEMAFITGTGCQLSALIAAFVTANPEQPLEAAAAAVSAMGLCGEMGADRMGPLDGNIALRGYIIDAMYNLTPEQLEAEARYEVR